MDWLWLDVVGADAKDAVFLKAKQTFTDKKRGCKPRSTWGMKNPNSLTGWYLRMLQRNCKQLLPICNLIVADAHFSKESFAIGVKSLGFNIISHFREDVNLKCLYHGPKLGKRGGPKKFPNKIDGNKLDMDILKEDYFVDGKPVYKMYRADVHAVSFDREMRIVIVDQLDAEKKQQNRKVFFCTNLTVSTRDIFDIYRTRSRSNSSTAMQSSSQAQRTVRFVTRRALHSPFNMSLSFINIARAFARQENINFSVGATKNLLHNTAMVDRFIAMFGKRPNMRLDSTDFKELIFYGVRAVA